MISSLTSRNYHQHIIGRGDWSPDHYESGGWVALLKDGKAVLSAFSHCSCYGTWEGMHDDRDWEGTPRELLAMAVAVRDPTMPERFAAEDDYDYPQLKQAYDEVVEYFRKHPEALEAPDDSSTSIS